ncbi:MAG TPA: beta-ketoacyl synthase N-terminal-like domain-containing protein, partial [Candidatus Elarobacter sp.]|nr:beta-ketoacyl synthase N-terminal-like domain-containing protein [Candidatus Elarobacter sp.]
MEQRRVVITGLGAITPLGNTYQEFWEGLIAGRSGAGPTTAFDAGKLPTRISAQVKGFDPDALFGRREARRMDRYAQMALAAAREAMADANFPEDPAVRENTGAIVATGIGGIITIENTTFEVGPKQSWDRISPFFVPMLMGNAASAQISMNYGLRGPVFALSSACASANDAFCVAFDKIVLGEAVAVVTGGSEAAVIPTAMGGFSSMKAMSTRNDEPEKASRPFDKDRDGFVLGEGAGIMIFEDREHALARGAKIYAEVLGYGQSADAFHIAQPDPESRGVILA